MSHGRWQLESLEVDHDGLLLAIVVALVTGLVVANWTGSRPDVEEHTVTPSPPPAPTRTAAARGAVTVSAGVQAPAPAAPAPAPEVPTQNAIQACNQYAASHAGPHDKTMEIVKDGMNRRYDERYRQVYASCLRARGYVG